MTVLVLAGIMSRISADANPSANPDFATALDNDELGHFHV